MESVDQRIEAFRSHIEAKNRLRRDKWRWPRRAVLVSEFTGLGLATAETALFCAKQTLLKDLDLKLEGFSGFVGGIALFMIGNRVRKTIDRRNERLFQRDLSRFTRTIRGAKDPN
jgi:hypothetical protein